MNTINCGCCFSRLSAKAGASQSGSQKKGGRGNNTASRGGGQSNKAEAEPPPPFKPPEAFPGITADSFPAMVNQRTQVSMAYWYSFVKWCVLNPAQVLL